MPTKRIRGALFFSSYFPLIAIICVLQYDQWPWWATASLASVGVVTLLATGFYFRWMRRHVAGERKKITNFSKHDSEVMSYIASYLIPFVTFPLDGPKQWIALGVFLIVLMVIYINSNMIYINPMLNIFGYHLYEIEIEHSQRSHYYIARKSLERNREIHFVPLSDDIYLEK